MALRIPRGYERLQVGIEFPDTGNPVKLPDGFKLNLGCAFQCECHNELKELRKELELCISEEEKARIARYELAKAFAKEMETWSSKKLREAYAQPETVKAAELREQAEKEKR